jgi:hypothetical protein
MVYFKRKILSSLALRNGTIFLEREHGLWKAFGNNLNEFIISLYFQSVNAHY